MKDRPILFSGEMVRAILDGRKSQTRRVIDKLKGYRSVTEFQKSDTPGYDFTFRRPDMCWCDYRLVDLLKLCPYGKPGDRLWVRESWAVDKRWDHIKPKNLPSKAFEAITYPATDESVINPRLDYIVGKCRSSRFMPRSASRITLEITEVRVERVQDISEEDALAEGLNNTSGDEDWGYECLIEDFSNLWDSINGKKHPWSANPWVWVVSFRRVEG